MAHGVERVGDDDDDGVRRVLGRLRDAALDDLVVLHQQIVAAHAGLPREAGGLHDDVGVGGVFVAVGADDFDVDALDGARLSHVEALALRDALGNVDENNVGEFLVGQEHCTGRAYVAGADDGDFLTHDSSLIRTLAR